jgi:UDP-N-acetylglucosamine:LPS N-acetylglucosamine transferase
VDNARLLADAGAAEMLLSDQVGRLGDRLVELLHAPGTLQRMGHAARSLARPHAVAEIADRMEELGGSR